MTNNSCVTIHMAASLISGQGWVYGDKPVYVSIMPVPIGDGIPFFGGLERDVALHLVEAKACTSGMVALRHEVKK